LYQRIPSECFILIVNLRHSLCNTTTTSQQTLLLHADGKKHRAKAKAFHASQKQANGNEQTPASKESSGAPAVEAKQVNGGKSDNSDRDVGKDSEKRKRVDDNATEVPDTAKRRNLSSGVDKEKIKWKKIITKVLKAVSLLYR
jgi:cell growth-regulating nucleolar protein